MPDRRREPTVIGFGKYTGLTVWQCPEHYLRWLVGQTAKSDHFRRLQEEARGPLGCIDDSECQANANELRWDGQ